MKGFKLKSIYYKNFKGIKEIRIDLDGKSANIFGDNGTGKTTTYDGFLWLLFDKNSENKKDFSIKPLDENNNVIHFLESEVEATLEVNGNEVVFRKVFSEKWTKKRGSATEEFSGHETSYWIDEVPVKKNEYQDKINELIDENIFKLVTNPAYFNTMMSWQERRTLLLKICGNVEDNFVIDQNKEFADLKEILNGKSTEDYKKIISAKISALNENINKIPIRIDELNNTLSANATDVNYDEIEQRVQVYTTQLEVIENELTDVSKIAENFTNKLRNINEMKSKLEILSNHLQSASKIELSHNETQLYATKSQNEMGINRKATLQTQVRTLQDLIQPLTNDMTALRTKFDAKNDEKFVEPTEEFNCPTCGQSLPEDEKEKKIAQMKANFEANKNKELEEINTKGKSLKAQVLSHEENIAKYTEQITSLDKELVEGNSYILEMEASVEYLKNNQVTVDFMADPKYVELKNKIELAEKELSTPVADTNIDLKAKKVEVQAKVQELNKILANKDVTEKAKARIVELEVEERQLASQIQEFERQKFLLESFIKAKVNMLESTINKQFKLVRFKLFDVQINGGINECCESLLKGVPYSDANVGGRINMGLDIINTLMEYYRVKAPIFVDEAISINDLYSIDTQIIRLVLDHSPAVRVEVL